jgi:hypothetical protein
MKKPRKRQAGQPTAVHWHHGYFAYFRIAETMGAEPPKTLRIVESALGCTISGRFTLAECQVATFTTRIAIRDGKISHIATEQIKVHFKPKSEAA